MALIENTINTYKDTFINNKDFIFKIREIALSVGWTEKRYIQSERDELILCSKDGKCHVGFITLTDDTNDISNIELQVFRDYNKDVSFHEQFLAIPKFGINYEEDEKSQPAQIILKSDELDKTMYVQISDNHIFAAASFDNLLNSCYLGYINAFLEEEQYSFPVFCGGNTQAEQSISIEDTETEKYNNISDTYSNFIFGRRDYTNLRVFDHVMNLDGRWNKIGDGGTSSELKQNYSEANIFPMSANGYNKTKGSLNTNELIIRKPIILSKPNADNTVNFLGDFRNLYIIESNIYTNEEIIEIENSRYIVFQDCYRNTDFNNFFLLRIGEV